MRSLSCFFAFIFFQIIFSTQTYAQCKQFAIANKPQLGDFIHDGAYTSIKIKSGQTLQINKTFYQGQKYRLAVCGVNDLGKYEVEVHDQNDNVIYSNTDSKSLKLWDFSVESTLNLTITIFVPKSNANPIGCLSILVGFKSTDELIDQYKNKKNN